MSDPATIRTRLREEVERPAHARKASGRLGEIIVENWLREQCRLEVQPLPQDMGTKRFLLPEGGKRPDFAVAFNLSEDCFFVDAKLHATNGLSQFSLDLNEIADFRSAMRQLDVDHLFIALLPRESVDRLYLISLDEIERDNEFGSEGGFALDPDDPHRRFGPITRDAYDAALERVRNEGFKGDVPDYP